MSGSDKKVGVVGLTLFDLRRRGKVGKLSMVGTSGQKFPAISKCCWSDTAPCTDIVSQHPIDLKRSKAAVTLCFPLSF